MLPGIPQPVIALLTDFGTSDPYVGVMKGLILTRCPAARFIDITHEVAPQNVAQAAYLLRSAYHCFPAHTIFLAVVDPGVGTERRTVAIKTSYGTFVGPDNGLFSGILDEVETWQAVVLWPVETASATFHGRDIFAPAAADLACGRAFAEIGSPTVDLVRTASAHLQLGEDGILEGEVIHIDHFGNLMTNLGPFEWENTDNNRLTFDYAEISQFTFEPTSAIVTILDRQIGRVQYTYGTSEGLIALINSDKRLEIAVNRGNAAQLIGARLGTWVRLHFKLGASKS